LPGHASRRKAIKIIVRQPNAVGLDRVKKTLEDRFNAGQFRIRLRSGNSIACACAL
jgi:hypothetical protein